MAKVVKAYNPLLITTFQYLAKISVLWFVSLIILILMDAVDILQFYGFPYLGFVCLMTGYWSKKTKINFNGLEGEKQALSIAKNLSSDYIVFSNVTLMYEEQESETDLIIVGPKGVFLIEVKNHKGVITGKPDDKRWAQFKETSSHGKYVNPFYNPTKQVKTHVYRLSSILKEKGYMHWVQGIVFFVNPEVEVKAYSPKIPILTVKNSFEMFIEEYEPKRYITKTEKQIIVSAIKEQIQNEKDRIRHKKQFKRENERTI